MANVQFITTRKAIKDHSCDMCKRTISPSEVYFRIFGHDGDFWWVMKECPHCRACCEAFWFDNEDFGEFEYGDVVAWMKTRHPFIHAGFENDWKLPGSLALLPTPFQNRSDGSC